MVPGSSSLFLWFFLILNGSWQFLLVFVFFFFWFSIVLGSFWQFLVVLGGNFWFIVNVDDSLCFLDVLDGFYWLLVILCDYWQLSVVFSVLGGSWWSISFFGGSQNFLMAFGD